jgi:hypothetical protein
MKSLVTDLKIGHYIGVRIFFFNESAAVRLLQTLVSGLITLVVAGMIPLFGHK